MPFGLVDSPARASLKSQGLLKVNGSAYGIVQLRDTGADAETIDRLLQGLEGALKRGAMRAGMAAIAKPIAADIKEQVPGKTSKKGSTGALKRSIGYTNMNRRQKRRYGVPDGEVGMIVGAVRKVAVLSAADAKKVRKSKDKAYKKAIREHYKKSQYMKMIFLERGTMRKGQQHVKPRRIIEEAQDKAASSSENRFYFGLKSYLDRQLGRA